MSATPPARRTVAGRERGHTQRRCADGRESSNLRLAHAPGAAGSGRASSSPAITSRRRSMRWCAPYRTQSVRSWLPASGRASAGALPQPRSSLRLGRRSIQSQAPEACSGRVRWRMHVMSSVARAALSRAARVRVPCLLQPRPASDPATAMTARLTFQRLDRVTACCKVGCRRHSSHRTRCFAILCLNPAQHRIEVPRADKLQTSASPQASTRRHRRGRCRAAQRQARPLRSSAGRMSGS